MSDFHDLPWNSLVWILEPFLTFWYLLIPFGRSLSVMLWKKITRRMRHSCIKFDFLASSLCLIFLESLTHSFAILRRCEWASRVMRPWKQWKRRGIKLARVSSESSALNCLGFGMYLGNLNILSWLLQQALIKHLGKPELLQTCRLVQRVGENGAFSGFKVGLRAASS